MFNVTGFEMAMNKYPSHYPGYPGGYNDGQNGCQTAPGTQLELPLSPDLQSPGHDSVSSSVTIGSQVGNRVPK